MPTPSTAPARQAGFINVVRVISGNFLEMYDFMVFGYYASAIAATFFPAGTPFASLMLTMMTFGAGFLMRPLGALVLGAYIDRRGRRAGLVLTLGLMAFGTLTIACVPGYATLGLLAPALVLAGRLLQGFSAGVELGGGVGLSGGNRARRQKRVIHQLAVRQSAARGHFCRPARGCRHKISAQITINRI